MLQRYHFEKINISRIFILFFLVENFHFFKKIKKFHFNIFVSNLQKALYIGLCAFQRKISDPKIG